MKFSIRLLYLYLFSFIGLAVTVIGGVRLIQLAIKVYVFKGADQFATYITPAMPVPGGKEIQGLSQADIDTQRKINMEETSKQRQREVSEASAMLIVGIPLYLYHWKTIQKEGSKKKT